MGESSFAFANCLGCMGGLVHKALASHHCGPGSISRMGPYGSRELCVGSHPTPQGFFSPDPPVSFLPSEKNQTLSTSG